MVLQEIVSKFKLGNKIHLNTIFNVLLNSIGLVIIVLQTNKLKITTQMKKYQSLMKLCFMTCELINFFEKFKIIYKHTFFMYIY